VRIEGVRWEKGGTVGARDYNFFYGKGNQNHQLGKGLFVHHKIVSADNTVKSVSNRMSYIVLIGRGCNIILNVHAPIEKKSDDSKEDSFYEELEQVFDNFP
jgi:hypothetical protein